MRLGPSWPAKPCEFTEESALDKPNFDHPDGRDAGSKYTPMGGSAKT